MFNWLLRKRLSDEARRRLLIAAAPTSATRWTCSTTWATR
jgi:hypothetical protein